MVAIIIPTKNRPEYLIRQLEFYAKSKSPHPVYIGDGSTDDHSRKIKDAVVRLQEQIPIHYFYFPKEAERTEGTRHLFLANQVKEEYICFSGDDDFQLPDGLTQAKDFLEKNKGYSVAYGHSYVYDA